MTTSKHIILSLLLLLGMFLQAQTPVKFTKKELSKTALAVLQSTSPASSTTSAASKAAVDYDAGSTAGEVAVNASGAITYSVPISVPSGIKSMAPKITLDYSGQAGNSLAGYGWNISGLSTITRIPSTAYHDGTIDPVNFDSLDRFALDGQRLLVKSGTYGADGTVYETENFSTFKIKAHGTSPYGNGPSHFTVFHPDGSIAWYGLNSNSRGRMEWAITKLQDPQGNYIFYTYALTNNLLRISTISYGANGVDNSLNTVNFHYRTRQRPEQVYVHGFNFTRRHILERIDVKASNSLYRNYLITHQTTSLGYEKIASIEEVNGQNKSMAPITFTYDTSSDTIQPYISEGGRTTIFPGVNYKNHSMVSGDFNGGMDMVLYDKTKRDMLYLFSNLVTGNNATLAYEIPVAKFNTAFASTALNTGGKFLGQQSISTVVESTSGITFNSYLRSLTGSIFNTSKTWIAPTYAYETSCERGSTRKVIPREYITGDFNGDGLTDVLAMQKSYGYQNCYQSLDDNCDNPFYKTSVNDQIEAKPSIDDKCCECVGKRSSVAFTYFIELDQTKTSNFVHFAGNLGGLSIGTKDRLIPADYDGDGKTDLLHFSEGKLNVYSLELSSKQLKRKITIVNSSIKMKWPTLLGDYNGDGKIDFATPTADKSSAWRFFIGTGAAFTTYSKNIGVWFGESGRVSTKGHIFPGEPTHPITGLPLIDKLFEYHYIARDYNGDGKSDILSHHVISSYASNDWSTVKLSLHVNRFSGSDNAPWFEPKGYDENNSNTAQKFGIPIFMDLNTRTANLEYAYVDTNNIYSYEFGKDHRADVRMRSITNNGITTAITYNEDEGQRYDVYTPQLDAIYPYIDIPQLKGFNLVSELQQIGSRVTRYQQFYYYGAKSHAGGLGFLGFQVLNRSNWYGDGVARLWTNTIHDPEKKGAVLQEWSSPNYSRVPTHTAISKSTTTYSSSIARNKRFKIAALSKKHEDLLQGITTTETISYDSYLNPLKVISSYPGGSKTVDYTYSNNPSATDHTYHIGRPLSQTATAVLGSERFSTSQKFSYSNNLLTKLVKQGNGSETLAYTYVYDHYGNLIRKDSPGNQYPNVEYYTYDASGRYMLSSKDHFQKVTSYTYDMNNGTVSTITDPFGLKRSFSYDGWQREIKNVNYLGKITTTTYTRLNNNGIRTAIDYPQGSDEITDQNDFGWVTSTQKLSLNGKSIKKAFSYDVAGRTTGTSEPYFTTGFPTQWNRIYYDEYGRTISRALFTGKTINTTYEGLKTIVNDGTKTVSTTKDAVGNVASVTDLGGTINYTYFANGSMKEAAYGTHKVTNKIDQWGHKTQMDDPSAGIYTYVYNRLGQITKETTPKNGTTTYSYSPKGGIEYYV